MEDFERVVLLETLGDENGALPVDAVVTDVHLTQVLVAAQHLTDGDAPLVVETVPGQIHRRHAVVPLLVNKRIILILFFTNKPANNMYYYYHY